MNTVGLALLSPEERLYAGIKQSRRRTFSHSGLTLPSQYAARPRERALVKLLTPFSLPYLATSPIIGYLEYQSQGLLALSRLTRITVSPVNTI